MAGMRTGHPSARRQSAAVVGEIPVVREVSAMQSASMSEIPASKMVHPPRKAIAAAAMGKMSAAAPEVCKTMAAEMPPCEMSAPKVPTTEVPASKMREAMTSEMTAAAEVSKVATAKVTASEMMTTTAEVMSSSPVPSSAPRVRRYRTG
jgi:hypothetical protein